MSALTRPAVFGAADGLTCFLGVVLGLAAHPSLVFPGAVGVGAAEAVGMAAGEWQSASGSGFAAAVVIGAATGLATIIPALPYAAGLPGWYARGWSAALVLLITAGIAWSRRGDRGIRRAAAESFGILAAVAVVVGVAVHFTPAGAA